MAKIPLPERGQPLDVTYIYELVKVVNELSSAVSPATYKYTSIDTKDAGRQNIKGSEARVIGGIHSIAESTILAGEEKTFTYPFPGEFKYAPIATATVINIGNTPAAKNVTVILNKPTTASISGVVRFNTSGTVGVDIHLIIIGVPN